MTPQPEILSFIYPEYVIAVIVLTELIKYLLKDTLYHPKWIGLAVAIVTGLIGAILNITIFHQLMDVYKMLTSFGVSIVGYDYLVKPIKDQVNQGKQ